MRYSSLFFGFILMVGSVSLKAQGVKQSFGEDAFRVSASRLLNDEIIEMDGLLNESVWSGTPAATNFIQNMPLDGVPASERTEVRILYTDKYLFIGARAYDSAMDSVAATLFRRDGTEYSDWIYVNIDSYNDDRTAFTFAVNPRGVQKDVMYYDDVQEDLQWDAVWQSKTSINDSCWTAELKIPLSQLRFTSSRKEQEWGINFQRRIARKDEISFWAATPREDYGIVSWFGQVDGISELSRPLRLELLPYASMSLTREPDLTPSGAETDPYFNENDYLPKIGGDIKYGLTSDFTLTGTVNPDFGQVEADPAVINLTNFEIQFDERRPFFLEGRDIFNFGGTNSENTFRTHQNFYSRRIGKTPYGYPSLAGISSSYEDSPTQTTIAGAGKVSGKTSGGFSLGILNAYTLQENALYQTTDGTQGKLMIEPATNYFVGRFKQDLNGGDSQVGGYLSSVNRNFNGSYLEDYLHQSAYQLGIDGQHNWDNRNWGISGSFGVSSVNGTSASLLRTQTTSARYYNRTDSDGFSVDSSKTSLSGYSGEISIGKYSGSGLRYSLTYSEVSPGYEINDIGFMERSDYRSPHYYLEYLGLNADAFRFYLLWANGGHGWNFDGDLIYNYYSVGSYVQFHNLWTAYLVSGITGTFYNDRITRGGPIMRRPRDWSVTAEVSSNTAKDLSVSVNGFYRRDTSGEFRFQSTTTLSYRPTGYIQLSLSPTLGYEQSTDQYQPYYYNDVTGYEFSTRQSPIFSNADIRFLSTEIRLNWTFTPTLSLQTFARPLLYTADFSNFKRFTERKTFNFEPVENQPAGDLNDFNYSTLQGNAVLRWEYRPGSTLYLVWQQQRESILFDRSFFDPLNDGLDLRDIKPTNIFLVKLSYWFGS
ncbi:DUF5916 domain-containing protein [Balneola sp. MJW-20]